MEIGVDDNLYRNIANLIIDKNLLFNLVKCNLENIKEQNKQSEILNYNRI